MAAFSPEQMITLGKALDRLVEEYGPLNANEREEIADTLMQLAEKGITDVEQLVEMARRRTLSA
jgi:citrate lyase alpha subunit